MYFPPEIINRFLGINEDEQAEIEVSNNVICREITAKQVKEWPRKGKLFVNALSVKYAALHRIGAANWVPNNHTSNIATGLGKFIYIVRIKLNFDFSSYVFLSYYETCCILCCVNANRFSLFNLWGYLDQL